MRVPLLAFVFAVFTVSGFAETWKNVPLIDAMCACEVKANPDAHTAECALSCGSSGMGILTSDGTFLKLDDAGTKQALAAIKASKRKITFALPWPGNAATTPSRCSRSLWTEKDPPKIESLR